VSNRFLSYGRQLVDEDDIAAVSDVLRGDMLTTGPMVERFERVIAERVGARHAIAVNSATSGLHIACLAARLSEGKEAITSPITFVASANCVELCGATARFGDIDPATLSLSPASLAHSLNAHPDISTVIPVHLAGLACDSAEIRRVAGSRIVIEDAAHSFGGAYPDGRPVGCGAHADMSVFSFHPVKPITTAEGGAVVTNDDELARLLRMFRSHGIERDVSRMVAVNQDSDDQYAPGEAPAWYYEQHELGLNYRMNDVQAALGVSQIGKLDRFLERRREIARNYDEALGNLSHIRIPHSAPADRARSGLHLYILEIDYKALGTTRAKFMAALRSEGIGTQVHYIPVYRQPYYRDKGDQSAFPNSEAYYRECLTIPLHYGLTDADVERVVSAVRSHGHPQH
jgi:perosamine synthetase